MCISVSSKILRLTSIYTHVSCSKFDLAVLVLHNGGCVHLLLFFIFIKNSFCFICFYYIFFPPADPIDTLEIDELPIPTLPREYCFINSHFVTHTHARTHARTHVRLDKSQYMSHQNICESLLGMGIVS